MEIIIKPIKITRTNFAAYGDLISSDGIKPIDINAGYAKRFDNLANINWSSRITSHLIKVKKMAILKIGCAKNHKTLMRLRLTRSKWTK